MKKLGLLTSGGDAPGMNAAIRSIVMSCNSIGVSCIGFVRGFNGLLENNYIELDDHKVKHISQLGGTILKTARCKKFLDPQYQKIAADNLTRLQLDGLFIIGGDGSFRGAVALNQHIDMPFIGIPATIDNDISSCDFTLGFQTAVQTATEAIDKIRDTADAHERLFIVEVMGRDSGNIAIEVGLATEAEQIICPEFKCSPSSVVTDVLTHIRLYLQHMGHASYIIVMAEHTFKDMPSDLLAKKLEQALGIECRAVVLGHMQRGGAPVSQDRLLGSKLGHYAVRCMVSGVTNKMVGELQGTLVNCDISTTITGTKTINPELLEIYKTQSI